MDKKYCEHIAKMDLRVTEYKMLLIAVGNTYTANQFALELGLSKSNMDKYIKSLKYKGLIELDRREGNNKFYRAVTDMKKLEQVMQGQMKI